MTQALPPNITLYYIRHGQTDWNIEGRMQGQVDQPLNATGRAQAARNGSILRNHLRGTAPGYDFICSPLERTRQTMEIARAAIGLDPADYRIEEALIEISFGDWEGRTMPEIQADDPAAVKARRADKWGSAPPGGESYKMLHERIGIWLRSVTRDSIIVSHGGVMRALRKHLEDLDSQLVPHLDVPQDKVMMYKNGVVNWL